MKNYEFDGVCWMCMRHTKVRCKNLYIIGSEGTDLCWECEKKVHELIQTTRRGIAQENVRKKMNEKHLFCDIEKISCEYVSLIGFERRCALTNNDINKMDECPKSVITKPDIIFEGSRISDDTPLELSPEDQVRFFNILPDNIKFGILEWGCSDTEVRDNIFVYTIEKVYEMTTDEWYVDWESNMSNDKYKTIDEKTWKRLEE